MNYSLKITPHARNDIRMAISYYNNIQNGLGNRFGKNYQ